MSDILLAKLAKLTEDRDKIKAEREKIIEQIRSECKHEVALTYYSSTDFEHYAVCNNCGLRETANYLIDKLKNSKRIKANLKDYREAWLKWE